MRKKQSRRVHKFQNPLFQERNVWGGKMYDDERKNEKDFDQSKLPSYMEKIHTQL